MAIILTAGLFTGDKLKVHLDTLLNSVNYTNVVGYFISQNDDQTKNVLESGLDIMITTPECLEEMIDGFLPYFGFDR